MKLIRFIICIFIIGALSSCKSSKVASSASIQKTPSTATSITNEADNTYESSLIESVAATYGEWHDVEIPIELELIKPQEFSVSGRATLIKNECIYISIRAFGFEVANAYINNDSIHVIYKMGKLYIAEDVKKLLKGYPVNVGDLQNLLLGRAFILGKGTISPSNEHELSIKENGSDWTITPKCDIAGVNYFYTFQSDSNIIKLLTVLIKGANPVLCNYSDIQHTSIGDIAEKLVISANTNQPITASIKWDTDNAKWNAGASPKWKAPKGYKRINIEDLLKAF